MTEPRRQNQLNSRRRRAPCIAQICRWGVVGIFFVTVASASPTGQPACQDHNPQSPDVPECPAPGADGRTTLLSENYPAMAVMISDGGGIKQFGLGKVVMGNINRSMGIDAQRDAVDQAWHALESQPDRPPQLILNVESSTLEALRQRIQAIEDPRRRALWMRAITSVPPSRFSWSYPWQQDLLQAYVNPQTGRPVLRALDGYFGGEFDAVTRQLMEAAKNNCAAEIGPSLGGDDLARVNGRAGGNVEGFPGGVCAVGEDHFSYGHYRRFANRACGGNTNLVEVDTQFLGTGHVDELVSIVPRGGAQSPPDPCAFSVVVASPRLGLELVERHPSQRAFSYENEVGDAAMGRRFRELESWKMLCEQMVEADAARGTRGTRTRSQWSRPLLESAYASDFERCARMTNASLLATLRSPGRNFQGSWADFNRALQGIQDRNRDRLVRAIKRRLPQCGEPRVIEVPALFVGRLLPNGQPAQHSAVSLFPGPTNAMLTGGRALVPDPANPAFRAHIQRAYSEAGVQFRFADSFGGHIIGGNLHCMTNVIRYCRPRAGARAP